MEEETNPAREACACQAISRKMLLLFAFATIWGKKHVKIFSET
jgi:hypothetical protein